MSLTNEDLKRLKEQLSIPFYEISRGDVENLLYRLECAENVGVAARAIFFNQMNEPMHETLATNFAEAMQAWRKSKGE